MTVETLPNSRVLRIFGYLKYKILHNQYLQGALAILSITFVFSLGYMINSGVPIDSSGDFLYNAPPLLEYLKGVPYFFSHWSNSYSEIGSYGVFPGNQILYLQYFFLLITHDLFASFKLLQLAAIFAAGFFMFVCFYDLTKRKWEGIFAGVLFMFAPFALSRVQGHIYLAWAFAFIPLVYLATYKVLTEGKWKYAILAALPLNYLLILFPEDIFLLGIPWLVFSIIFSFTYGKIGIRKSIKRLALVIVMFGLALWMGLSSYIAVLGTYFQSILSASYPITNASTSAFSYPNPPFSALMLFDGEALKISVPLTQANIILIAFSLILLISSSICLLIKRNGFNLSLFIAGLLSVILSMGLTAPNSLALFAFARNYLPYVNGIATPGRFIMTSYFVYIFLGILGLRAIYAIFVCYFQRAKLLSLKTKYSRVFTIILSIILIVAPAYLLSSAYGLETTTLPPGVLQTQQLLGSYNPQSDYRAIDLVSHNGLLYILDQRTTRTAWDIVARYYTSPSFAEILAKDNIKYIVASNSTDQFVFNDDLNQVLTNSLDFSMVTVNDNCSIYINNLANPRIYSGSATLIVGGPNAISLLYALNDTSNDVPLYAQQLLEENMSLNQMVNSTGTTVFHDSDALDLAFLLMNQSCLVQPWQYANSNWSIIQDNSGGELPTAYLGSVSGQLNFADFDVYTDEFSQIQVPYTAIQSGSYDIWIRVKSDTSWDMKPDPWFNMHYYRAFEPQPANNFISLNVDGSSLGNLNLAEFGGYQWLKVGTVNLSDGTHELQINTTGNPVYLDSLAIVPQGLVEDELSNVNNALTASSSNSLYLLEFSNYFHLTGNATRDVFSSNYTSDAASGYVTLSKSDEASTSIFVSQAGNYSFQVRASNDEFDFLVDATQLSLNSGSPINENNTSSWIWCSGSMYLSQGYHNFTAVANDNVNLDMLSFQYFPSPQNTQPVSQLNYSQVTPDQWIGNITLNQPTQLVLTENSVPDWSLQLTTNDNIVETLQPNPSFYTLNSFYINDTGTLSFKIMYSLPSIVSFAQTVQYVPYVTWVIALIFTVFPVAKFVKRLKKPPL